MRNCINISGNDQVFPYIIEYQRNTSDIHNSNATNGIDINWYFDGTNVNLLENTVPYCRKKNDWYKSSEYAMLIGATPLNEYVPELVETSNIKVYIPSHSINRYVKNIKYIVTANTWINGHKINLGSHIFSPIDTRAIEAGCIKNGNNEYFEYVDFKIIDPFYLIYADKWIDFRHNICEEPLGLNNTGSSLNISMFVVEEYNDRYMIKEGTTGGSTSFIIADDDDYLQVNLSMNLNPLGLKVTTLINKEYNSLSEYLKETYNIIVTDPNIHVGYDIVIKSKDSIIPGPTVSYAANETLGKSEQIIKWNDDIKDDAGIKILFDDDWNLYSEGWNFVCSLSIIESFINDDNEEEYQEIFTVVSNEIPITQEVFSMLINGGAEQIISKEDMIFNTYNVVNKIENKILQIDRPNESKSNVIQPVFFRVKDTEVLTLHPKVTENISINLDDYKSKVNRFTLMICDCKYEQIGANSYGILFKVNANTIPDDINFGTYYILDENKELVTTGRFSCVR